MTKEEFLNLKIGDIVLYREATGTDGWKVFEAIDMVTSELLDEYCYGEMCFETTVIQTNWKEEAGQKSKIWYGDHDKMIKLA